MKLNQQYLPLLTTAVTRPFYDPAQPHQGIIRIGVGGLHHVHQAVYADALMNRDEALDWAICGAGLRGGDRAMHDALAAQSYFYTLYELGDQLDTEARVIGVISGMLLAEDGAEALLEKLAEPAVRTVSLTITKGDYCIDDGNGESLAELPLVRHDLANPWTPHGAFDFLCKALWWCRDASTLAFTVTSCDNLPHNDGVARKALLAFTEWLDPGLACRIVTHVSFPNVIVDCIIPVTSPARRR